MSHPTLPLAALLLAGPLAPAQQAPSATSKAKTSKAGPPAVPADGAALARRAPAMAPAAPVASALLRKLGRRP